MPKSMWELWAVIITIVEFDINYFVYSKTGSKIDVITIIGASTILPLTFIISHIYSKIKELEDKQEEAIKKLIRDKELEDIRLDLREIKRKVFKNG
ncbi:MAG: hypothetical protein WC533_02955 [Candidatus Pacearchaeota archaeon]